MSARTWDPDHENAWNWLWECIDGRPGAVKELFLGPGTCGRSFTSHGYGNQSSCDSCPGA